MQELIIRYIVTEGAAARENRVVIHPADTMRAKRDLYDQDFVDDDYRIYYHAWLACRRTGATNEEFDPWLDGVAEVEAILTEEQIEMALATHRIDEAVAALWRRDLQAQGSGRGKGRGKSQAAPT